MSSSTKGGFLRDDATGALIVQAAAKSPNTQAVDYVLQSSDAGGVVEVNAATSKKVTIPTNASVAFPIGTQIEVRRIGAGAVTIVAAGGVTLDSKNVPPSATVANPVVGVAAQYSSVYLTKRATDEWVLTGDTFSPLTLRGLQGWFNPDTLSGADASSIAEFGDVAGLAGVGVQVTGASQPTLRSGANGVNGHKFADYDGGDSIGTSLPMGSIQNTIIAVVKPTSFVAIRTIASAGANSYQVRINTTGQVELVKEGSALLATSTVALTAGQWAVIVATYDFTSGAWAIFINGAAAGSGTQTVVITAANATLGQKPAGGENMLGGISDFLKCAVLLDSKERMSLEQFLAQKHAIAVS